MYLYGVNLVHIACELVEENKLFKKRRCTDGENLAKSTMVSRRVGAKVTFYNTFESLITYENRGFIRTFLIGTVFSRRLLQSAL